MNGEFKPLLAVGIQYIKELETNKQVLDIESIGNVLENYINGLFSYEFAEKMFIDMVGDTSPLEKIRDILQVDKEPLPNKPENPIYSQIPPNLLSVYKKKTHPWSEQEDKRLLNGIHKFGLNNWVAVSTHVGNSRTKAQCSQRWFRGLDPRISKVLWTKEEENKLKALVQKYGERSWTKVATELGSRSDAQCRYHYRHLTKSSNNEDGEYITKSYTITPISSAPSVSFKGNTLQSVTSQSMITVSKSNMQKIPSIDSFSNLIDSLPNHLKFELPPVSNLSSEQQQQNQ